ncbi:hypothetical protein nvc2_003 [Namao virus]|nr:hypothetical protein nvc2_003 [Namao virus]
MSTPFVSWYCNTIIDNSLLINLKNLIPQDSDVYLINVKNESLINAIKDVSPILFSLICAEHYVKIDHLGSQQMLELLDSIINYHVFVIYSIKLCSEYNIVYRCDYIFSCICKIYQLYLRKLKTTSNYHEIKKKLCTIFAFLFAEMIKALDRYVCSSAGSSIIKNRLKYIIYVSITILKSADYYYLRYLQHTEETPFIDFKVIIERDFLNFCKKINAFENMFTQGYIIKGINDILYGIYICKQQKDYHDTYLRQARRNFVSLSNLIDQYRKDTLVKYKIIKNNNTIYVKYNRDASDPDVRQTINLLNSVKVLRDLWAIRDIIESQQMWRLESTQSIINDNKSDQSVSVVKLTYTSSNLVTDIQTMPVSYISKVLNKIRRDTYLIQSYYHRNKRFIFEALK